MPEALPESFVVTAAQAGATISAVLRSLSPGWSWKQVRHHLAQRYIQIDGSLCLDPARRLKEGETVQCLRKPVPLPRASTVAGLVVRYFDEHLVVVEKASGINTVRHPAERQWKEQRRALDPTLEDLTQWALAQRLNRPVATLPRLRIVHRLDKETSGLVVFARSVLAERGLGMQFHAHSVIRRYLAVVPGGLPSQTIRTWLIRDRGDGRRGSDPRGPVSHGKEAITHIHLEERIGSFSLLSCRLETGRTHQIRIHLAELGHPVCGEKVYHRRPGASEAPPDRSGAPRLALHAAELGFQHPATAAPMHWTMDLPPDLQAFLDRLRADAARAAPSAK